MAYKEILRNEKKMKKIKKLDSEAKVMNAIRIHNEILDDLEIDYAMIPNSYTRVYDYSEIEELENELEREIAWGKRLDKQLKKVRQTAKAETIGGVCEVIF